MIIKGIWPKNLESILLLVDFSKTFDSIHRGKMEQILLANDFPKEAFKFIMIFDKDMMAMVSSLQIIIIKEEKSSFSIDKRKVWHDPTTLYKGMFKNSQSLFETPRSRCH